MANATHELEAPRIGSLELLQDVFGWLNFWFFLAAVAVVIYYDDIQITPDGVSDAPTIFNVRILGLKILDIMALVILFLSSIQIFLEGKVHVSVFHKYVAWIFLSYWFSGIIGFINSLYL